MISYLQAQQILAAQARSFGQEKIGLDQAYGRVLAEQVQADRDYPPFHRSAMDGYAIRYNDWEEGLRRFRIVEIIYAGTAATKPIGKGECYKIMTGAPVPPDADTVIRREDTDEMELVKGSTYSGVLATSREPAHIENSAPFIGISLSSCQRFQNISPQGEDMHAGDIALGTPSIIGPAVMGILASLGKNECLVEQLPRVALFTTGNEIVPVDTSANPIQIRNSNRWIIQSFLKGWGISPFRYEHLPDVKDVLRNSLAKVIPGATPSPDTSPNPDTSRNPDTSPVSGDKLADIIILSGGVSAGDADYIPEILEELGVQRLFHKIAIKPGKPVWCGVTPAGSMVFALPGNPFSGMVNFTLLIRHYLHACFSLAAPIPMGLPLATARKKRTPLDEFFPVRITGSPARLQTIDINGSGDSRLGLYANALALHPAESGDLLEGANVLYYSI